MIEKLKNNYKPVNEKSKKELRRKYETQPSYVLVGRPFLICAGE